MNGFKGECKEESLVCCGRGKQFLYLGVALFVIGVMLQNNLSLAQIIELIGAFIVIISLITMLTHKEK